MHGAAERPVPAAVLAGGGAMGAFMRAHDWSATPLGDPSGWPQSLHTALSMCLGMPLTGAVLWGPDHLLLYNEAYADLLADRHPRALGRPVLEVWTEIAHVLGPQLAEVRRSGRSLANDKQAMVIERAGGAQEPNRIYSFAPIVGEDGAVAGILKTGTEATSRMRVERARREGERRLNEAAMATGLSAGFRALFEASPTPFLVVAPPDWTIVAVNDARLQLTQLTREEQLGRGLFDLFPDDPNDPDASGVRNLSASLDRVVATKAPDMMAVQRYDVREPGGRFVERWWSPINLPVLDGAGEVALVIHRVEEVTEVVRLRGEAAARDQLARDQQVVIDRLQAAEEALRGLNDTLEGRVAERTTERDRIWRLSTDLMLVAGFDATIAAVNPAWTSLLGWPHSELIGRSFIDFVHPEDVAATVAEAGRLADGETTLRFENRYRHKDGSYRDLSWTAVPGDDLIHAVARDVTAEKAKHAELETAQEALRQAQKMEAVGQLTGGVAHDFNNLLTVIKSSTDLLKRPGLPDERRARYVAAISDTVDRAAKLTGQLLAFARRQALRPEVFDAGRSVQALGEMLGTITGSRISISLRLPDEPCAVNADPSQFDTALVNMAVNARDAMGGEGALTLTVWPVGQMPAIRSHKAVAGDFVAVSVADTGSGIPPAVVERIFEPFFTTKGVGQGTGLGLSQVFGFAKQSGGEITVESEVGRGSTFTLYLPRALGDPRRADSREPEALIDGHGTCVLVVEDNVDVGTFAMQTLSDLGYDTVLAANGTEALAVLAGDARRFDVVFSDVIMPGMSGIELGQEIRRRHADLPVVLTSGYSHVLAENGTFGFELLHKPYSIEDLSRVLRTVAGWHRRKRLLAR